MTELCDWCNIQTAIERCIECGDAVWCSEKCRHNHWGDEIESHAYDCAILGDALHPDNLDDSFDDDNIDVLIDAVERGLDECAGDPYEQDDFLDLGNEICDALVNHEGESENEWAVPQDVTNKAVAWLKAHEAGPDPSNTLVESQSIIDEVGLLIEDAKFEYQESMSTNSDGELIGAPIKVSHLMENLEEAQELHSELHLAHTEGKLSTELIEDAYAFIELKGSRRRMGGRRRKRKRNSGARKAKKDRRQRERRRKQQIRKQKRGQKRLVRKQRRTQKRQQRKQKRKVARQRKRVQRKAKRKQKRLNKKERRRETRASKKAQSKQNRRDKRAARKEQRRVNRTTRRQETRNARQNVIPDAGNTNNMRQSSGAGAYTRMPNETNQVNSNRRNYTNNNNSSSGNYNSDDYNNTRNNTNNSNNNANTARNNREVRLRSNEDVTLAQQKLYAANLKMQADKADGRSRDKLDADREMIRAAESELKIAERRQMAVSLEYMEASVTGNDDDDIDSIISTAKWTTWRLTFQPSLFIRELDKINRGPSRIQNLVDLQKWSQRVSTSRTVNKEDRVFFGQLSEAAAYLATNRQATATQALEIQLHKAR